tara:strand:+ start:3947 stop:4111 length:165 start_codon:yes stop_codon:yes gene_type:complete
MTTAWQDCSGLLGDKTELRQRVNQDGFGMFRGLVPKKDVLDLRRLILEMFNDRG